MQRWLKSVRPFGSFQLLSLPSFQRKGLYFVNYSKAVLTLISHHLITQFPRSKRKDTTWPHLLFPRTNKLTRRINNKHLMTGPEGNSEFCFPRISMFPETKSRETLRFEGNKIHCSPRDQSLSDLLYSKTKQKQNLKTALRFQPSRATAVNSELLTG